MFVWPPARVLNDLASCLQSCTKAYECLGQVKEREGKWADAAANYTTAWKIGKRRHPGIGG